MFQWGRARVEVEDAIGLVWLTVLHEEELRKHVQHSQISFCGIDMYSACDPGSHRQHFVV